MNVYVLILNDRHSDVDAQIVTDAPTAVLAAYATALAYAASPAEVRADQLDGYLVWVDFSAEGDYVAVVERTVDPDYRP